MLELGVQPRLQIVRKREASKHWIPTQAALFPSARKPQLIIAALSGITDHDFLSMMESTQPTVVVDLRRAARFNIGRLNRRDALRCFEENRSIYFDCMAISETWSQDDRDPDLRPLFEAVHRAVPDLVLEGNGPILFLVAQTDRQTELVKSIVAEWRRHSPFEWDVCEMP